MLSFIIYKVALGKNYKRISCFTEAQALRILLCQCTAKTHTANVHRNFIQEIQFQFILLSLKGAANKVNPEFLNLVYIIFFFSILILIPTVEDSYLHCHQFTEIKIYLKFMFWCPEYINLGLLNLWSQHIIESYFRLFTRCPFQNDFFFFF